MSTRWAARSVIRRPPQVGQKPRPLHENGTRCSRRAALAAKAGDAVLEDPARQKLPELSLDELRQACAIARLHGRAQERLEMLADYPMEHRVLSVSRAIHWHHIRHAPQ